MRCFNLFSDSCVQHVPGWNGPGMAVPASVAESGQGSGHSQHVLTACDGTGGQDVHGQGLNLFFFLSDIDKGAC